MCARLCVSVSCSCGSRRKFWNCRERSRTTCSETADHTGVDPTKSPSWTPRQTKSIHLQYQMQGFHLIWRKKFFRACVQQDVALLLNLNVTHYIESNMFLQVRISVALQWKVAIRISRKRWNVEHLCLTKKCNCLQARLAQSVERKALNLVVVGLSPTVGVFQFSALRTQSLCKCVFLGIRPRRSWPFS